MRVYKQQLRPFDADKYLGIAIKTPCQNNPNQHHVGIIYRVNKNTEVRICHLAWHYDLRDEILPTDYLWGISGLDSFDQLHLAAYVALLENNSKSIPYGIDYDYQNNHFDNSGQFVHSGKGLTCATFILAVLAQSAFGFILLDATSWPERESDAEWQKSIIDTLKSRASPEYIETITKDLGAKRYRPEEVVAGFISHDIPLSFEQANNIAQEVIENMRK